VGRDLLPLLFAGCNILLLPGGSLLSSRFLLRFMVGIFDRVRGQRHRDSGFVCTEPVASQAMVSAKLSGNPTLRL